MNIAHENTARALKDQPLFAIRQWYCRFGVHAWCLWNDPVKTRRGSYDYVEQYRKCGCCGKAERRLLSKD